jgi:hypothetical protein
LFEQNVNIFLWFSEQVEMASLEEVWGSSFPKKSYDMTSKHDIAPQKRDAEKEGRVAPTPIHRSTAAIQKHRKTIDDLTKSLPIGKTDDDYDSNYGPAKVPMTKEHMTDFSSIKGKQTNPYYPRDDGTDFAYAPLAFQSAAHDIKLDRILRMIEQNRTGYEAASSQDMMLYIFTGVFFLYTLDTFVNLGRRLK